MNEEKHVYHKNKGATVKTVVLLMLPFILAVSAMIMAGYWGYSYISENTPLKFVIKPSDSGQIPPTEVSEGIVITPPDISYEPVSGDSSSSQPEESSDSSEEPVSFPDSKIKTAPAESFPKILYGQQWATLNAQGWDEKNIPVYFGDENKILSYGAGMSMASYFAGKGKFTVISAHVTSYFHEIEDSSVGDTIILDTTYGRYLYTVKDVFIFDQNDESIFDHSDDEAETLIIYTCYPRENGYAYKTQRIALICELTEGVQYVG